MSFIQQDNILVSSNGAPLIADFSMSTRAELTETKKYGRISLHGTRTHIIFAQQKGSQEFMNDRHVAIRNGRLCASKLSTLISNVQPTLTFPREK